MMSDEASIGLDFLLLFHQGKVLENAFRYLDSRLRWIILLNEAINGLALINFEEVRYTY